MKKNTARLPKLLRSYQAYLNTGDTAQFIYSVAENYNLSSLYRLAETGSDIVRRAAVLAIGMLGDLKSIGVLGPLLSDEDRKVRMVADDAIKSLWHRSAPMRARCMLEHLLCHIESNRMGKALEVAEDLIAAYPQIPETYCRRALAYFNEGKIRLAVQDCKRCIELAPFHYMAYVGLGQCYLEISEPRQALHYFRTALAIYPDLDAVRVQVKRLERMFREMT